MQLSERHSVKVKTDLNMAVIFVLRLPRAIGPICFH
jgi:hypothetical protein